MATIRQWEDSVIEMETKDIQATIKALETLNAWPLYKRACPKIQSLLNIVVGVNVNRAINT